MLLKLGTGTLIAFIAVAIVVGAIVVTLFQMARSYYRWRKKHLAQNDVEEPQEQVKK